MEAARNRLGLPLTSWWQKCDQELADPRLVLELEASYAQMMGMFAWKHYTGLLFSVEDGLRDKVLTGLRVPGTGEDLTPYLRMGHHLMSQVIALPEAASRMRQEDERDLLGMAPEKGQVNGNLQTEFLG